MWDILALVACLIALYLFWPASDYYKKGRKLPGPTPLPIFGNMLSYYFKGEHALDVLLIAVAEQNGLAAIWQGNSLVVLVSKPEYFKVIFGNSTMVHRADQYRTLHELLGSRSIFTASGDVWKETRKQLKQSFEVTPMEIFFNNFKSVSEFLINELDKVADGEETKVFLTVRITLTQALLKNVLGTEQPIDVLTDLLDEVKFSQELAFTRQFFLSERFDSIFKLLPKGRRYFKSCQKIRDWIESLINDRRADYHKLLKNEEPVPNLWIYNMLDKFPERDHNLLREDLQTLVLAGLDTTSGVLGYALLMMGLHPELQEKMYEEAVAVRELTGGREIIENDIKYYEFADRFIRETLRIFPIGELSGRKLTEDTYFGEHLVPKGADVIALFLVTYRDPEVWPNPLKFDPDRFLPENCEKMTPFSYLPFSHGRRVCPGQRYSMCALKLFLPQIALKFRVGTTYKSVQEVIDETEAHITLCNTGSFPCTFTRRS